MRFLTEQDEVNANRIDPRYEAEEDAMWDRRLARFRKERENEAHQNARKQK